MARTTWRCVFATCDLLDDTDRKVQIERFAAAVSETLDPLKYTG